MNSALLNPPPTSSNDIANVLAILAAISNAPGQAKFLAAVVDKAKAEAQAVLDAANAATAALANSQAELDRQRAALETERAGLAESFETRRAALEVEHAAKVKAADDLWNEAAELVRVAKESKSKYEGLTADLIARVTAAT